MVIPGGDERDGFTNSLVKTLVKKSVSILISSAKAVTFVTEYHQHSPWQRGGGRASQPAVGQIEPENGCADGPAP